MYCEMARDDCDAARCLLTANCLDKWVLDDKLVKSRRGTKCDDPSPPDDTRQEG